MTKIQLKYFLLSSFLLTTSQIHAGNTGTVTYTPFIESIPTLSGWMLILLSILLMTVALRITKNKKHGANKLFITLIGVSVLTLGSGGIKLVNDLVAAPPSELSNPNGGNADVFENQLNTFVNTSGINQQVTNVDVSGIQCDNYDGTGTVLGECVQGSIVSTGASCNIDCSPFTATITLIKVVVNDNGGTLTANDFALTLNGQPVQSGVATTVTANTNISINEQPVTGYQMTGISGDAACPAVLGGTVTLAPNQNLTCTITNDDLAASITLNKVVTNDNGGTAGINDFGLTIGGTPVTSGQTLSVSANTSIILNEDTVAGYQFVDITGDAACPTTLGGTVTLTPGQAISCTINNDDIGASITLNKVVTNDNGGTAGINDFGLIIGGTSVTSGQTLAVSANTTIVLNEVGLTGYQFVSMTGTGCPTVLGGTVTLNPGENIICSISNDDIAPTITLNKSVTNDNGGTANANDFGLTIGGTPVSSGQTLAVSANTPIALDEVGLPNYTFISITGDTACPATLEGTVNLSLGQNITCTINNDDFIPPTITLIKAVNNDDGGTLGVNDFGLNIGGTLVNSGQTITVAANTPIVLNEATVLGYQFVSMVGTGCPASLGDTVTLTAGQNITCTITNDDLPRVPLRLAKYIDTDNSGGINAGDEHLDGWSFDVYLDGANTPTYANVLSPSADVNDGLGTTRPNDNVPGVDIPIGSEVIVCENLQTGWVLDFIALQASSLPADPENEGRPCARISSVGVNFTAASFAFANALLPP